MNTLIETYLLLAGVVFVYMSLWFFVALMLRRNDVADIAWWIGFFLVALIWYLLSWIQIDRGFLVTILVGLWWIRIATHIYQRNLHKPEDYRYKNWRDTWGKYFLLRSYLQIFMLQGIFLLVIIAPVIFIQTAWFDGWTIFDLLGVIVWCIGFFFEVVGDRQLAKFIKNPENKGKIIQTGLWKYSRHPNYFWEVTQWWGIWITALSIPHGYWSIFWPIMITFLILKVSGIPMLEKRMQEKEGFEEYARKTNAFFPWFQK